MFNNRYVTQYVISILISILGFLMIIIGIALDSNIFHYAGIISGLISIFWFIYANWLYLSRNIRAIGTCNRCGSKVYTTYNHKYSAQCYECDEDLFNFEYTKL